MKSGKETPPDQRLLINKLTVKDARDILRTEGGEFTAGGLALQLLAIAAVAAFTARAIWVGNATVWHLALPMVAQYFALILALPIVHMIVQHPDLRKEAYSSLRLLIGLGVAGVIALAVRSYMLHTNWQNQLNADAASAWRWIADAEMQWPILAAFLGMLIAIPGRVRNLFEMGPPFVGVSLGCAMRFVVLMLGFFLIPWAVATPNRAAWSLWNLILASELLALWMLWDIQQALKKIDAPQAAPKLEH
jgi:hypothetical protein